MQNLDVINLKGEKVGKINLKPEVFQGEINQHILYQDIRRLLSSRREGTASTKTRKEIRGGGAKPWRQKGTGRARIGSIRAPHWRGGGVIFGPHPRDYSFSIPKKVKKSAVKSALRVHLKKNSLIVIDEIKISRPKTKEVEAILKKLKLKEKKVILLLNNKDKLFFRAAANIKGIFCKEVHILNTYDILYHDILLFSKDAFESLEKRLS